MDLNDGHLAVRRLDTHGNPVGAAERSDIDFIGLAARRDAQVRRASPDWCATQADVLVPSVEEEGECLVEQFGLPDILAFHDACHDGSESAGLLVPPDMGKVEPAQCEQPETGPHDADSGT